MTLTRTVGVLALQGDFEQHTRAFAELGVPAREVKRVDDLKGLDGLVIPGGESTAMTLLMTPELREGLLAFAGTHPIWGTCAGMIMLSKDASDPRVNPLGLLDAEIERNGYGRQVHSFEAELRVVEEIGDPSTTLHGIFIRAPRIKRLGGGATPLVWLDAEPVCIRQNLMLASAFHPELTRDTRLHRYFLGMMR
jgi:pyridoxal 5'-phosphate synthase pdxT subunit